MSKAKDAFEGIRYLLDTNTLLHVCLISNSYVRELLGLIAQSGGVVIVSSRTIEEALHAVKKYRDNPPLFYIALNQSAVKFDWLIDDDLNDILLCEAEFGTDAHIYSAAKKLDASVVTGDIDLIRKLREHGIPAHSAVTLRRNILEASGQYNINTDLIIRTFPFSSKAGSVYVRASSAGWHGVRDGHKYTLFDFVGFGWCYFDSNPTKPKWVFKTPEGELLIVLWGATSTDLIVSVSFERKALYEVKYTLRVAESPSDKGQDSRTVKNAPPNIGLRGGNIGHTRTGHHYLNGTIANFLTTPHSMSGKTWKKLINLRDEVPDPGTANTIVFAIKLCQLDYSTGQVILPSHSDVIRRMYNTD